jgi:hypothetical protein
MKWNIEKKVKLHTQRFPIPFVNCVCTMTLLHLIVLVIATNIQMYYTKYKICVKYNKFDNDMN